MGSEDSLSLKENGIVVASLNGNSALIGNKTSILVEPKVVGIRNIL